MKNITKLPMLFLALLISISGFSQIKSKKNFIHPKGGASVPSYKSNGMIPYTFSASTGTYTDLSGSISVNNGITWDDPYLKIPVGFNFQLFDEATDSITLDGNLGVGGFLSILDSADSELDLLIAYGPDICDRASDTVNWDGQPGSLSAISYKLEGSSPNRVLKIEWKNAGFYNDIQGDNNSVDFINFQLWLYETSSDIEIHIGSNFITQPALVYDGANGPLMGLAIYNLTNDSIFGLWLTGNSSAPVAMEADVPLSLNDSPADGTIYKFIRTGTGIQPSVSFNQTINIYPALTREQLNISLSTTAYIHKGSVSILNLLGQVLKEEKITTDKNHIAVDVSKLDAGMYLCAVNINGKTETKRFIVVK